MLNVLLPFVFIGTRVYASTIGPVTDLPIVNAQISPDGFSRSAVLAGGTFPGPVIVGQKDDLFKINVIDQLQDKFMYRSTSIHWHGLNQHGTNWADGTATVSQCPITPGHSFEYRFKAAEQAGTFWYHSHLSTQYCDGLRGPFIVYDPNDPHKSLYDVDDESTIITLADCRKPPQTPDSGRYPNGTASPLAVINVEPGKRYRFRLISMSCEPNYVFSIDGHNITVIEADGHSTESVVVNSIQIFAGQRYSFVLNANANNAVSRGNFWIRALPNFGASTNFDQGMNLAILRYRDSPVVEPTTSAPIKDIRLNENDLHPLQSENPGAPGAPVIDGADVDLNLVVGFNSATGQFNINGSPYAPPSIPVLLQILSGNVRPEQLLPAGSVYTLPANKSVQLSFPIGDHGDTGGPHPVHLHGHPFSVVRSASSPTYNFVNPVRRDVTNTGATGDNVTIRFFTGVEGNSDKRSSGVWFLHCHIDRHLEGGLAVVFAEDIDDVASANPVPDSWKELCPDYENEFGSGGEVPVV
ncbi:laccase [Marasmius fiardii PR-910]|nr:laccase [Marasmius fiardii PR-910]